MYKQEKVSNLGYIRQDTEIGEKSNDETQIQPLRAGLYDLEIDDSLLYEQLGYKSHGKYAQLDLYIDLRKSNEKHSFQAKTHDLSYRERSENETSKRLVDRIQFATINLYNYNKTAYQTNNQSVKAYVKQNKNKTCTGHTLEIAQCKYLAVIDIDIDHEEKLDDIYRRDQIRNSIIQLFQPAKQQDFEGCNVNPEDAEILMEKYNQHRNVGLVKSARGGLHIYCNMGPYKLEQNSMVNVICTKDFSVDVFACVDAMSDRLMDEEIDVDDRNKTRRIVQPGTQIQKYRDSKRKPLSPEIKQKLQTGELRNSILTYQDLNNAYEKMNLAEIQDVFLILGFDIKVIQRDEEKLEKIEERKSCLEKCEMTKEQAEILVHGLDDTIIHTNHPHSEGKLSLFTLCTYINGLRSIKNIDEDFINECYDYIEENCDYSLQAQTCFQAHRERNSEKQQSPYCLQGFIKKFKIEYYTQQFIPKLAAKKKYSRRDQAEISAQCSVHQTADIDFEKIQVHNIDIKEQFGLDDIIHKIRVKPYDCVEEIISDLTKILRIQKYGSEVVYLLKQSRKHKKPPQINVFQGLQATSLLRTESLSNSVRFDVDEQPRNNLFYEIQRLSFDAARKFLDIHSKYNDLKSQTLWQIANLQEDFLLITDICFLSEDPRVFSIFQGWKYDFLSQNYQPEVISPFLHLVRHIIANNNEQVYEYILNWISHLIQYPQLQTEVCIILTGLEGTGKNTFTNILSELMDGYSEGNLTKLSSIGGKFNSSLLFKVFAVGNELRKFSDMSQHDIESLKSIITDNQLEYEAKYVNPHTEQNVTNLILISNHSNPVQISITDRRYLVLNVNSNFRTYDSVNINAENTKFFKEINELSRQKLFYDYLLTFLAKRDISTVNIREIPLTQAKEDIIEASLTDIDIFIRDHFKELKDGMNTASALSQKPINIADKTFQIEIKQKCEYKVTQIKKIRHYSYKLKQEFIPYFEKLHGEYAETIDKGFNE